MNIEELREMCLSKKGSNEYFPFDEHTLTFKVLDKVFAITSLNEESTRVNLKCDPEYAIELREQYNGIIPGYHMNKKHWNTISIEDDVPDNLINELIEHSYQLVKSKLTLKQKAELD